MYLQGCSSVEYLEVCAVYTDILTYRILPDTLPSLHRIIDKIQEIRRCQKQYLKTVRSETTNVFCKFTSAY